MASIGGAQLERQGSVRRSQSMVLEEDRGSPADEELMVRSQGGNCEPVGGGDALRVGAVLDKDSVAPKSCPAKHEPSGKSLIRIRPSRPSAVARAMAPVFYETSDGCGRYGSDEGEVRQAVARGGHVGVRERGALRPRPLQRRH
jgi:hypothetical protein